MSFTFENANGSFPDLPQTERILNSENERIESNMKESTKKSMRGIDRKTKESEGNGQRFEKNMKKWKNVWRMLVITRNGDWECSEEVKLSIKNAVKCL